MNIKRLYKKPTFIAVMVLVVAVAFALGVAAKQESGFVHIVLASYSEQDSVAESVIEEFLSERSIVRFSREETPEMAIKKVSSGEADEAWIFSEDIDKKLDAYSSVTPSGEPFVRIVGREENMFLSLTREKLTGTLYKYCARSHYLSFARNSVDGKLDGLSDGELLEYLDKVNISEELFVFGNGDVSSGQSSADNGYITAPLRGLFGVLCVVAGLSAAMYYAEDEKRGAFSRIPENKRGLVAFSAIAVAVVNIALVSLVSMQTAGVGVSVLREVVLALVYTVCVSAFSLFVLSILKDIRLIGAVILPISVIMIAVCPVFFDFRAFIRVQLMLPPTYYVNAAYDAKYIGYMLMYAVVCVLLSTLADRITILIRKTK